MEFPELVRTRRTVHNYAATDVDQGLVREALTLALWAPNHRQTHPLRFVEIGPVARAGLIDLALDLKSAKEPVSDVKRDALRDALMKPPYLIGLALKRADDPVVAREDYATLGAGVQTACLHLWRAGISTKWSTAKWTMSARSYALMGLNPEIVALEGCLMIGRAKFMPNAPNRPALAEVMTTTA
jgi:nitroreductase